MIRLARPLLLAAALLFGAGVQADVFHFKTILTGAGENPDVITPATGRAAILFDTTAQTLDVHVEFAGLLGNVLDAHIHCCTGPLTNASVAVGFMPWGFPLGGTSGVFDAVIDLSLDSTYTAGFLALGGGTAAGASAFLLQNLLANMAYVNIHTTHTPSGEIRGQLAVPEPTTVLLLAAGLLTAVVSRRRRV